MKTITYQGVQGAFSHITAVKAFGGNNHFISMDTFQDVFKVIECGEADYAVIPIENSLAGSIYENYDLLNTYDMHIVGEHLTKVEHCLLAISTPGERKEERLSTIKKVLSHPKALEQCSSFFQRHPWIEAVVASNTAVAAAEVASKNDLAYAAIASAAAGTVYGLDILEKGLEDDPKNYTRFVIVMKKDVFVDHANKCSLIMQLKHIPGAIVETLKEFADQGVNLTKIESRPIRGVPFEYLFYIDFEFAEQKRQDVKVLLHGLCNKVQNLKILGFYKRGCLWIA